MKSGTGNSKFAAEQLKKFGWKEGDGIGKSNQGIVKPIKASFKFDNSGLGFSLSEEITNNWWDNLYNSTAKRIEEDRPEPLKIPNEETVKPVEAPLNKKSYFYSRFQKGSTLIDGRHIETPDVADEKTAKKNLDSENGDTKNKSKLIVSDEELFRVCNGRTAHKGARHGIKMNGKLARIEQQEKLFVEVGKSSSDEEVLKKKNKKRKHLEQVELAAEKELHDKVDDNDDDESLKKQKKKKKSKNKDSE